MPNVTGLSVSEAKKILKENGLEVEINQPENGNGIVINQIPKKGIHINTGTKIIIYSD